MLIHKLFVLFIDTTNNNSTYDTKNKQIFEKSPAPNKQQLDTTTTYP